MLFKIRYRQILMPISSMSLKIAYHAFNTDPRNLDHLKDLKKKKNNKKNIIVEILKGFKQTALVNRFF